MKFSKNCQFLLRLSVCLQYKIFFLQYILLMHIFNIYITAENVLVFKKRGNFSFKILQLLHFACASSIQRFIITLDLL